MRRFENGLPKILDDPSEQRGREAWAATLRQRLGVKDMTRQRLAAAIGVSRAQLDKYADGSVTPPGKHLGKIADLLDFDIFEQLELLDWLGIHDVRGARERRVVRSRLRIHEELQRLVRLDAEVSGARPALTVVDPLLQDGWTVRHWVDWRGTKRRVSYFDILELDPPARLRGLLADPTPAETGRDLPAVDRAATLEQTHAELRLRAVAEETIGLDLFHVHECYWSERVRHRVEYRGHPPLHNPGLVLVVPWFLRRRFPTEDAALLTPVGARPGTGPASLVMIGLPYSGGPDLAGMVADEILHWGCAGVAMLTRERWHSVDVDQRAARERQTARGLASGADPRADRTVLFYNEPEALVGSVNLLITAPRPPAVVHLRFTDRAIDEFLLPEWGNVPGRQRADLLAWRDACDAAESEYARRSPGDWHTIHIDISGEFAGIKGEDARSDLYFIDLAAQVEDWLRSRYGVRRPPVEQDEQRLLDLLAGAADGTLTTAEIAAALAITGPAAKLLTEKVMTRHGLGTREDLYSFAEWRSPRRGRA